eukprot:TRINITY_DN24745_c0_g1_i1.p2 TRINITY_DN24745_c0_g1~~TRINITY_DN24745_c0_g1_i1.p2  ORF type:complete len:102 (-),score=2.48 TRINITY_DN24745_c0_g1_i1:56-361(-)
MVVQSGVCGTQSSPQPAFCPRVEVVFPKIPNHRSVPNDRLLCFPFVEVNSSVQEDVSIEKPYQKSIILCRGRLLYSVADFGWQLIICHVTLYLLFRSPKDI